MKSPCDSMITVTPAVFAYAAIAWKPSTTRFITSSFGSSGGSLSPNMRTYGTDERLRQVDEAAALVELLLADGRVLLVHPGRARRGR